MDVLAKILINLLILATDIILCYGAYRFYNRFPLSWFWDVGFDSEERDGKELLSPRLSKFPDSYIYCAVMIIVSYVFYLRYDLSIVLFCNLFTIFFLSYLFVADIKTMILPDQFITGLIFVSLFWFLDDISYLPQTGDVWYMPLLARLLGGLAGGITLLLIHFAGSKLIKQDAIGMGDIKLVAACGLCTGINGIFWVLSLSFIFAFIPALIGLITFRKSSPQKSFHRLPFAPFIVISTTLYLLFPSEFALLFYWYSSL